MLVFLSTIWGKLAVLSGAVAVSFAFGVYQGGKWNSAVTARAAVKATVEQLKERGQINEDVMETDIVAICIELGGDPAGCGVQANEDQ